MPKVPVPPEGVLIQEVASLTMSLQVRAYIRGLAYREGLKQASSWH